MIEYLKHDDLDDRLRTGEKGRLAHNRGKLVGAIMAKACGAESPEGTNEFTIDGHKGRFHSCGNGKTSFSLNPKTEPPVGIVAIADKAPIDGVLRHVLRGVTMGDCLREGRKGKSDDDRLALSVSRLKDNCVRLGAVRIPVELLDAPDVEDRDRLMKQVESLPADVLAEIMDGDTVARVRQFVTTVEEAQAATT